MYLIRASAQLRRVCTYVAFSLPKMTLLGIWVTRRHSFNALGTGKLVVKGQGPLPRHRSCAN